MKLPAVPSQRDVFLKTLDVHQAIYEKSRGTRTDRPLPIVVLTAR